MNLIILRSHRSFALVKKASGLVNVRRLHAIDGELKLSGDIHQLKGKLSRTVFILDACDVGIRAAAFQRASGALEANWARMKAGRPLERIPPLE